MANHEQNPPQQEQPFVAAKQLITGFQLLDMGKKFPPKELSRRVSFLLGEDIIIKLKKKQRENVIPYTRFLSLLVMHKMKDEYGDGDVTLYPTQVFSVNNWALKPNQPKEPPFTDHMLAICSVDKLVVFKAPKLSSNAERVLQGTKPEAQPGHKKHSTSSKQPLVSSKEATKGGSSKVPTCSKTGHSKKRKESNSAMDSNLCQPPVSTPMDIGMHKEDQQANGGPTSLGVTSEARAGMSAFNLNKPIYSTYFIIHSKSTSENDVIAVSTTEVDPGKYALNQTKSVSEGFETVFTQPITGKGVSSIARQVEEEEASSTIKLEDLVKLVSNVQPSFKDLDSPEDDLVIVVDDSDEDEEDEVHTTINAETKDTSVLKSLSPRSSQIQELTNQLNELLVKSLQTEFSKILSAHEFSSSLPTELKDLPSKFNKLTEEVKGLKKQVYELEIELPGDLKEIPTKLKDFTKTVTSLTSQVAELKTLQWELPAKFLSLPVQVASVQAKLKSLDALPGLLLNVTNALNKFAQSTKKQGKKAMSSEEVEKESTNSGSNDDDETHVTGFMVESSTTKKLKKFDFITEDGKHIHLTEEQINQQKKIEEEAKAEAAKHEGEYDRYCDKMLNRRAESRFVNCDVLTKKGPITLKVYREDGTSEVIPNFKASDLHLGKWREVVKACPNRTGKGWKTIYSQIQTRMDYLHTTEVELGINLDIPLSEQDPLDKLNDLENKKRIHADDIHDYFKTNKRLKLPVQNEDHLPGTMLNGPILGLGPDDHARTFSSLLLAEVDKSNLNPHKQMRTIEQLRQ
ncbi:hypothetical protein Tco_0412178 [Tanacetum coccineum]